MVSSLLSKEERLEVIKCMIMTCTEHTPVAFILPKQIKEHIDLLHNDLRELEQDFEKDFGVSAIECF